MEHGEEASTVRASSPRVDVEALKKKLINQPVDEQWWEAAHLLLEKLGKENASDFLTNIDDSRKKALFTALIAARFDLEPKKLKEAIGNSKSSEEKEASKEEYTRRTTKDPNVKLISDLFGLRPEVAMIREDKIQKAIEKEDEKVAAELISELLHTKSKEERDPIEKFLKKELEKEEVKENPRRLRLVQRLLWSAEENLGKERGTSGLEKNYKDKVAAADEKARKQNAEFNENVAKAAAGDKSALKRLFEKYEPETLLDFMVSQKNVDLAKALGWTDKDGNLNLDLKASDPGFHPEGSPQTQTLVLGSTPDEIKKGIENFSKVHGPDFESSTPTNNRFARFTLNQDADRGNHRHFFEPTEAGAKPIVPNGDKKKLCQVESIAPEKKVPLGHTAWYFFRQFPESNRIGYAAANGAVSENYMVDLEHPEKESRLPGPYDPVPTPDERYITVPSMSDDGTDGIKFYMKDDAVKNGAAAKPFFQDDSLKGVYQSIGKVSEDAASTTYRIITDQKNLSFRDYKVTHGDPAKNEPAKVEALRTAKPLCENTGIELVTPMLSKDGKQVSFLDVQAGVTKIFDIVDPDKGTCKLSVDLGIYTGKVDFSYNGDDIVFHKYENERPRVRYLEVPSDELVGNVYHYKRSTGQLTRLTNNTNSNSIYPVFRKKDGMVMYLDHSHKEADGKETSSIVVVDPKKGRAVNGDFIKPVQDPKSPKNREWQARTALGSLWSQICSEFGTEMSSEAAALATLNLFPDRCEQLVDDFWLSFKNRISENRELAKSSRIVPGSLANLTRNEVKNACPKEGGVAPDGDTGLDSGGGTSGGGGIPGTVTKPGVPQGCMGCHSNAENFIPFNDLDMLKGMKAKFTKNPDGTPMSMVEAIFDRIQSQDPAYRMPRGGTTLTTAERVALRKYLLDE